VEDELRFHGANDVSHGTRARDVAQGHIERQVRIRLPQRLLQAKESLLVLVDQRESSRPTPGNLPGQLRADRTARAGHEAAASFERHPVFVVKQRLDGATEEHLLLVDCQYVGGGHSRSMGGSGTSSA